MRKIFVTSDTFFGRVEIIDIVKRPFESITEMNEALIEKWNALVGPDDIVYHLGNFAWSPIDAEDVIVQLNGHIKLIPGDYDDAAFDITKYMKDKIKIVQSAFYKEPKTNTVLSHWPMLEWPGKDKGVFHFHGHSINKYKTDLRESNRVNVCTDNWSFEPKEIKSMLDLFKEFKESKNKRL